MATDEITLEEIEDISDRPSVLKPKDPKPRRPTPPKLSYLESSPRFLNMPLKEQVRVYDQWRVRVMDHLEDPGEKAMIDGIVRARVQEKLESRGVTGEAAQSLKESFLGTKANWTRGINAAVAQAARIAATDVAVNFPGTNEEETRIAETSQNVIKEADKQLEVLREEFIELGQGGGMMLNRDRRVKIAEGMRALEDNKRKAQEALDPILEKTKTESWLGQFAGNQQLAADQAKASLDKLSNRFRKSDSFVEDHPYVNAIASGAGEMPGMIMQSLTKAGAVSMALNLGQRSEDMARELYPELTEGEAFTVRATSGAAQMALERMGIDATIGRIFKGSAGLTAGQVMSRTKRAAIGGTAEGLTEPSQSILEGEIVQAVTGVPVDTLLTPEALKDRTVDAVAGKTLGAGTGFLAGGGTAEGVGLTTEPRSLRDILSGKKPKMADAEGPQSAPPLTPEEAADPRGVLGKIFGKKPPEKGFSFDFKKDKRGNDDVTRLKLDGKPVTGLVTQDLLDLPSEERIRRSKERAENIPEFQESESVFATRPGRQETNTIAQNLNLNPDEISGHALVHAALANQLKGRGLGQAMMLSHYQNIDSESDKPAYFYGTQQSPEAALATLALERKGLIELTQLGRKKVKPGEDLGEHVITLTDKGREADALSLIKDPTTAEPTAEEQAETPTEAPAQPTTVRATVQARDRTRTAEVEFQNERDRAVFAAFRNLQRRSKNNRVPLSADEVDLINEATDQGIDLQRYTNQVLDLVENAETGAVITAPPLEAPPAAPAEGGPAMVNEETAPPLTPEEAANPAGTATEAEGPVARVLSSDRKKDVAVQFRSERDKNLFAIYRKLQKQGDPNPPKISPEEIAFLNEATESGLNVQGYVNSVLAGVAAAESGSQIVAPEIEQRPGRFRQSGPEQPPSPPEATEPARRPPSTLESIREIEAAAEAMRGEQTTPPATEPDVPRGTIPEPAAQEPRAVFRQVRQAVTGVPGVRTRITERKKGSGVTWTKDGEMTFTVTPSDLQGKGDDARFVMDEEVTHLAEVLGARNEWEAGGREGTFPEFLDKRAREHVARIDEELLDLRSADRQTAARSLVESIRTYTRAGQDQNVDFGKLEQAAQTGSIAEVMAAARESGVIGSDAAIFSEWLRQIDQIERTGTTTELAGESDAGVFARLKEAIVEALRKAIEWIDRGRAILSRSPTFTGDIAAITRKRQELSLPALTRPQTTETPPVAETPRTPPEVVEQQGTEGMPMEEAARVHRTSDPPPSPPLRATQPGEGDGFVTGLKMSEIDAEREAWGLPPREPTMRKAFKEDWGPAQEINMDGQAGSVLVNQLLEKSRPLSTRELAILAHEQIRRRHELDRAMMKVNDSTASETQRNFSFERFREAQVAYNRFADALQNSSSELGRSLNFLKIMADDQFNLVTLKRSRQAGVNGGEPLTKKQHEEIEGFFNRVQKLRNDLDKANDKAKNAKSRSARETAARKAGDIEFELAKEITKQVERDNKAIFKRLDAGKKVLAMSTEVLNLSRAMMTTFDFSATLRQGGLVSVVHPILASRAFKGQMEAFQSERGEFEVMQGIRKDPLYNVMVADGNILYVADTTLAVDLDKEQKGWDEAYQSVLSRKIPVVKGFGRGYQTFLNKLRFDYYKQLADSLSASTKEERNAIAKWVNITTGRGGPQNMGDVANFLGAMFFAPRYVMSRFQYLATPVTIWSQPKRVRWLIAKEFGKQLSGIGTVMTMFLLAKEAFDDEDEWGIEWDRRSSDFAKLRIGNTRVDILSGLQQFAVLQKRMFSGQTKRLGSGEVVEKDPVGTTGTFLRSKLSPVIGTSFNVLSGENVINQPAGLLDMQDVPVITNMTGARAPGPFVDLFVPLVFSEIVDAIEEQGAVKGTALGLATILGWAASTYGEGDFGETEGGSGALIREYGYGGLIKELYTRSTEEGKLLLRAFEDDKPMMYFREERAPALTPEEAANPFGR